MTAKQSPLTIQIAVWWVRSTWPLPNLRATIGWQLSWIRDLAWKPSDLHGFLWIFDDFCDISLSFLLSYNKKKASKSPVKLDTSQKLGIVHVNGEAEQGQFKWGFFCVVPSSVVSPANFSPVAGCKSRISSWKRVSHAKEAPLQVNSLRSCELGF